MMKPTVRIINTSRGSLIDTIALAAALTKNKIAGAALDVFEEEPLPADHPIRFADGMIMTSHVAWYSSQSIPVLQRKAAEEVVRALTGLPLLNRVA